jgi:prephenate dehydratase
MIMEEKLEDAGAIASAAAAEIYGGRILRKSIEDDRQNFTRFFLLRRPQSLQAGGRRQPVNANTEWKTSLVFSTRNVPGSLFRALAVFALRDLNLTMIESRPMRGKPWEYLFYLDFLGRVDSPPTANALNHLRELSDYLRVLGCYPKGA